MPIDFMWKVKESNITLGFLICVIEVMVLSLTELSTEEE